MNLGIQSMMKSKNTDVSPWSHPLRGVAFDMDGLLVNTEELYTQVGSSILERRGKNFTRELKNAMTGLPGPQAFALMIEWENLDDDIEMLELESRAIFENILPTQLRLLEGVASLLDRLDALGLPRCIATSSSPEFANKVLTQVQIIHRFDFIITSRDVQRGKPNPDIYWAAAQGMKVLPEQMIVLEDSHHGCRAGVQSGACTIAVPGPHSIDHDFTGAHLQATSLADPAIETLLIQATDK
jgi:pseudouridine-5'-monophosphatase